MRVAIVVTFYPDINRLRQSLEIIASQVDFVLMVDNGSRLSKSSLEHLKEIKYLFITDLGDNTGLGHAINVGLIEARRLNANYVVLFDQDSVPAKDMVHNLICGYEQNSFNQKVAIIGPRFVDVVTNHLSQHIRFENWCIRRIPCPENEHWVSTDFLITSGSLIPLSVLDDIGGMDESLFIDHVDTEWCLRAKSKGYELLGDCEALMEHDLGEYRKRIWFGRWREVPVHKPFRYYYIFRNSILLYKRDYIPWAWIRIDMIRLIQIIGFTVFFGPQRFQKLRMMLRGLIDGLRGKSGKLDG
ncbi:MAG: glycosyltransferase family 2 protein [Halothiobacillaceae bacterium]